jgi:hypothetical protein
MALVTLCVAFSGCLDLTIEAPPAPIVDAGPIEPPTPTSSLRSLADEPLLLGPAESSSFAFIYEGPSGQAIPEAEVTFAMVGPAHDSTLQELSAITDTGGKAPGTVMAGSAAATFRIRATALDARPAYIDVAVSAAGFGNLRVNPVYEGERLPYGYDFSLHNGTCEEIEEGASEPLREIQVSPEEDGVFLDLPAGSTFSILAEAIASDGHALARGCVSGVVVAMSSTNEPAVELYDLPLDLEGRYDISLEMETAGSALVASESYNDVTTALVASYGTPSGLLLQSLREYHSIAGITEGYLRVLVETGEADRELSELLAASVHGYDAALQAESQRIRVSLASISVTGTLVVAGSTESPETWMTRGISIVHSPGATPSALDISELIADRTGAARLAPIALGTEVELRELSFVLPLGAIANEAFLAGANPADTSAGSVTSFRNALGCGDLNSWVRSHPEIMVTCDEACQQAACDRAVAIVAYQVQTVTGELNISNDRISLSGSFTATDDDNDRYPEALSGPALEGAWATDGSPYGDEVTGALAASRTSTF